MICLSYFQLRVCAYDNRNPDLKTEEDVIITIRRNINSPNFARQTYTEQITERTAIGTQIAMITATDLDVSVSHKICLFFQTKI